MIRERLVESLIRSALKEQQVVLVDGIEGCGKTFTSAICDGKISGLWLIGAALSF